MARHKLQFNTEWLVSLHKPSRDGVHSAIVYRMLTALNEETGESTYRRLWVAARGYAGGGIYEDYSGILFPEGEGLRLVGCNYCYGEPGDFDEAEFEYLKKNDFKVVRSIWLQMDRLTNYDLAEDGDTTFTAKVDIPSRSGDLLSKNWDGNLLAQVSQRWPLSLHFEDQRSKRKKAKHPLLPLLPRPAGVEEDY